jgi:hypothetical protein
VLRAVAAGLVPALLCVGIVLAGAGSARAAAILDPNNFLGAPTALNFMEFNSLAAGTSLSSSDANNPPQVFADDDVLFNGVVVEASTPFFSRHVGASSNKIMIQFQVPVFYFGIDVQSDTPDPNQPSVGLTFKAFFESGATETHQFPITNDPPLPNTNQNGPPFSFGTTQFVGFIGTGGDLIDKIEFFQSPVGSPETLLATSGTSFPRVGNTAEIQVIPEPSTLALLGLALAGLAGFRRRTCG